MDKTSWIFKKRALRSVTWDLPSYFVVGIQKGILRSRLNQVHAFVSKMDSNTSLVSKVVPSLNRAFHSAGLSFRWFPDPNCKSGSLLIKNDELGLVVPGMANARPQGIMLVQQPSADGNVPLPQEFCPVFAGDALTKLSSKARQAHSLTRRTVAAQTRSTNPVIV